MHGFLLNNRDAKGVNTFFSPEETQKRGVSKSKIRRKKIVRCNAARVPCQQTPHPSPPPFWFLRSPPLPDNRQIPAFGQRHRADCSYPSQLVLTPHTKIKPSLLAFAQHPIIPKNTWEGAPWSPTYVDAGGVGLGQLTTRLKKKKAKSPKPDKSGIVLDHFRVKNTCTFTCAKKK